MYAREKASRFISWLFSWQGVAKEDSAVSTDQQFLFCKYIMLFIWVKDHSTLQGSRGLSELLFSVPESEGLVLIFALNP